ncbi:hypothetical protein BC833DRAFT_607745 [Globomyces pollinis-pini]|nr:hypothetical protein BC833DRAFT_607745 [Globomyces pollinis-pini]
MNAFFVYRKYMTKRITEQYQITKSQDISIIAGQSWALEPEHVKKYFYQIALAQRSDHLNYSPTSPISGQVNEYDLCSELPNGWVEQYSSSNVSVDVQLACSIVDIGLVGSQHDNLVKQYPIY